jgi:hypothetical protein
MYVTLESMSFSVHDLGVYVLLVALEFSYESKSLAPCRTLDRPAPFVKGGCCAYPGMRYRYTWLEQGYEEESVFTQAGGKAYPAIAADTYVSPRRSAPQQVEVIEDLERILQGHACIYLIMQDELVVLEHHWQWFQAGAHRRYRELSARIQFMEQGLSWYGDHLYLSHVKTRARPATHLRLVDVPRSDSQVERHSNRPDQAFRHFLHDVMENDWYVSLEEDSVTKQQLSVLICAD